MARYRFSSMVATPVGQRPEEQSRAWMQPNENMKGLAMLHQSAPNAQILTISYPLTIFPEAATLILSLNPAPLSALSTNTTASRNGLPRWSVNSTGAAQVPPSDPSTVMKSSSIPVSTIALTIATNSHGCPIQSFIPTGLPPDNSRSFSANWSNSLGVPNEE
jgi:hypothetical protein